MPFPKIIVYPQAKQDIAEIIKYLAKEASPDNADEFLVQLNDSLELLRHQPSLGVLRSYKSPLLQNARMKPIKGFPKHLIFYQDKTDTIHIIRIIHSSRDIDDLFA